MTQLAPDEHTVWKGRQAWPTFLGSILLGAMLVTFGVLVWGTSKLSPVAEVLFFGGGLIIWARVLVQRVSVRYEVTSQRAIVERGLLSRQVSEIELINLRDIQLRQSLEQRLFRVGTLELSSAGRDIAEVIFTGIANPDRVKDLVRAGMRGTTEKR